MLERLASLPWRAARRWGSGLSSCSSRWAAPRAASPLARVSWCTCARTVSCPRGPRRRLQAAAHSYQRSGGRPAEGAALHRTYTGVDPTALATVPFDSALVPRGRAGGRRGGRRCGSRLQALDGDRPITRGQAVTRYLANQVLLLNVDLWDPCRRVMECPEGTSGSPEQRYQTPAL